MKRTLCALGAALLTTLASGAPLAGWSSADFTAEVDKVKAGQAALPTYATPEGRAVLDAALAPATVDRLRDEHVDMRQRLVESARVVGGLGDFIMLYRDPLKQGQAVSTEFTNAVATMFKGVALESELLAQLWAGADKSPANQALVDANKLNASAANLKVLGSWAEVAQEANLALTPVDRVRMLQSELDTMAPIVANVNAADRTKLGYKLRALKVLSHDDAQGRLLDAMLARVPGG